RTTGCQFSFTCDGSLARAPLPSLWLRARQIAVAAISGYVFPGVGLSTFYHADYVAPYCAPSLVTVTTIGRHIFYRWGGLPGEAIGFTDRYAAADPFAALLRAVPAGPKAPVEHAGAVPTAEAPLQAGRQIP